VCDHVTPHKGDLVRFWSGPFMSLCKLHHDSTKQREDNGKVIVGADAEGWPTRVGAGSP
jgi:5-methylcytosine-specific restriction enzyme A